MTVVVVIVVVKVVVRIDQPECCWSCQVFGLLCLPLGHSIVCRGQHTGLGVTDSGSGQLGKDKDHVKVNQVILSTTEPK